jgi:hypothetical protein
MTFLTRHAARSTAPFDANAAAAKHVKKFRGREIFSIAIHKENLSESAIAPS